MAEQHEHAGQVSALGGSTDDVAPGMPTLVGAAAAGLPDRIGRYRIRRLIGSGGMGAVYEAVQEQPRRTVALKVLGMRMASPAALRRFEYEAQVLGRLRHPAIAQVYEAGTHTDPATGVVVPYFAMEHVPGARPLTEYAGAKCLDLRARLELFVKVCEAVQHGHLKGIIHRDLKPANILVDSTGQPKVIDFGVARATDGDVALATFETQVGQLIGTIQYMSPEQCAADPHDIDARSDVYALGVVLYELLSGKLPYDLSHTSLVEASRVVQQQPAGRLSQISPALRGDIETIAMRALEKDRDRRYESVAALAADIGRYLRDEPVHARRIGPGGRLVRWVRRNRAIAGATGIALAVLIVVSTVLIARIVAESARATRHLRAAEQNLRAAQDNFALVRDLFGSMRPGQLERGLVDVEQLLDLAADRIAQNPPSLAATEADFRELLGQGYGGLGLYAKCIANQRRALEIRESLSPGTSAVVADSLHQLAAALWWNGEYDEAEGLYLRSLEMRRRLHDGEHADIAMSLTHLAACHLKQGSTTEAEELYTEALAMRRRLQGPRSQDVAASLNNLAKCVMALGDDARAEELFRQALGMITELVGEADLNSAHAYHNLAACLLERGGIAEAEACFSRAMEIRLRKLRPTHHLVASSRLGLAQAAFALRPGPAPLAEAKAALAAIEAELPAEHFDVAHATTAVAEMLVAMDRPAEAEPLLRRALDIAQRPKQPVAAEIAEAHARLGECLTRIGRDGEAEAFLLSAHVKLTTSPDHRRLHKRTARALQDLYERRGDHKAAARFGGEAGGPPR